MSAVPPTPRVKLRSTSRRVPRHRAGPDGTMLEADPEPTMRLSRAILVMLLLHIVAIGGFLGSSLIKDSKTRQQQQQTPETAVEAEDLHLPAAAGAGAVATSAALRPNIHVVRPGETLTRIANESGVSLQALVAANGTTNVTGGLRAGQELKLPAPGAVATPRPSGAAADALALIEGPAAKSSGGDDPPARPAHLPPDSGKLYTVGKGDSPVSIAHKLKVNQEALLRLNQIDDPKKLKPGQKLRIPAMPKPSAKHSI